MAAKKKSSKNAKGASAAARTAEAPKARNTPKLISVEAAAKTILSCRTEIATGSADAYWKAGDAVLALGTLKPKAMAALVKTVGYGRSTLFSWKRVVKNFGEKEVVLKLLKKQNEDGWTLTWSHIEVLAREPSDGRGILAARALKDAMTVGDLRGNLTRRENKGKKNSAERELQILLGRWRVRCEGIQQAGKTLLRKLASFKDEGVHPSLAADAAAALDGMKTFLSAGETTFIDLPKELIRVREAALASAAAAKMVAKE